jgi:amino acid permease
VICFVLGSIQTLNKISWVTTAGFVSIMAGIITISVAVGVQERPAAAPQAPLPWDKGIASYVKADFLSVVSACITAVFGLAGTPMFFPVISEMRKPKDFNKSLAVCQSIVVSTYITIAVVVWYYCGICKFLLASASVASTDQ